MKLPDRVLAIRDTLLVNFPLPMDMAPGPYKEEIFRAWCVRFARQLVYSEPGDGWGVKRASEGSPIGKDTIANSSNSNLIAWDLFIGTGSSNTQVADNPDSINITGQVFVSVEAVDSLDGLFPPEGNTTPPLDHYKLTENMYNEHGWALSMIMDKLGIPH